MYPATLDFTVVDFEASVFVFLVLTAPTPPVGKVLP